MTAAEAREKPGLINDDAVETMAQAMARATYALLGKPALFTDEKYEGKLELAGFDLRALARAAILALRPQVESALAKAEAAGYARGIEEAAKGVINVPGVNVGPRYRLDLADAIRSLATTPASVPERQGDCHKLDTPERVFFYEQDFYVLSNFSAFSIRLWGGMRFDTSEAAYHWAKFDLDIPASREVQNRIYHARSAHDAFKIAEASKQYRRPDWDDIKIDKMRDILRAKVNQHEYVRRKLLATGTRELVEDSWRDGFWGWGPNRDGQNMLGKLWMEIRSEIAPSPPASVLPATPKAEG